MAKNVAPPQEIRPGIWSPSKPSGGTTTRGGAPAQQTSRRTASPSASTPPARHRTPVWAGTRQASSPPPPPQGGAVSWLLLPVPVVSRRRNTSCRPHHPRTVTTTTGHLSSSTTGPHGPGISWPRVSPRSRPGAERAPPRLDEKRKRSRLSLRRPDRATAALKLTDIIDRLDLHDRVPPTDVRRSGCLETSHPAGRDSRDSREPRCQDGRMQLSAKR